MSMIRTAAVVLLRYGLSLVVASVAIFSIMRLVPGNPARVALGINATEEAVAALSESLGLNEPWHRQYLSWVGGLLRGDFGTSLSSQQPITAMVIDRAQVSLIVVFSALAVALLVAIPAGMALARRSNALLGTTATQLGIAVPSFVVGIVLVAIFAVRLRWLPAHGWVPPGQDWIAFASHLVLPVISLALVQAAMLSRYIRAAVRDVAERDFIRTSRALGNSHAVALRRHGLRNAALPVLTVTGVQLSSLIVGAVVIESVFVIPGLGSMLLDAVGNRDLITVQTLVMLLVAFTLSINMVVDLLYRVVDPRLRVRS